MPSRTFVDTLFVIALINTRDNYHQKALALAAKYEGQPLLVTDAVLLGIGNGLARGFKQQAIRIIEDFLSSDEVEVVHLTPELFQQAFQLYEDRLDKNWGLVDCISFAAMADHNVTDALTFDQHFQQAGFRALLADESA